MTIHEASLQLRFQLFHLYNEREAGNITDLVMENITDWQKIDRIVNKTVPLSEQQQTKLEQYTAALLKHTPLQYVLHEAWFYGMKLYVDEKVLIPRPETEELVDWLLKENKKKQLNAGKVLDIGTGSGCIPLAIKKNLPAFEVHSCDVSESAITVARKNANELQLDLRFHVLDILSKETWRQLPMFDAIISNPPYIPLRDKASMADNVLQYEPHLALFVADDDALLFYRAIADFAKDKLVPGGCIYLEIHEEMAPSLITLYKENGFTHIPLRNDLQGKERMMRVG